jgi:UDP-N-acetyl-D-mannosaminuronate dehydrogenase
MMPTLQGKRVTILGLGFKKNIDDTRYSLSLKLRDYLTHEGADVAIHDPFLASLPLEEALSGADAVILAVNHDVFGALTQKKIGKFAKKHAVVCDIWDMLGTGTIVFRLP